MSATKTHKATAKGKNYEMTVTVTTTPNGKPGVLLTCSCATHGDTPGRAIVATPSGLAFPKATIHGHVTMVNGPQGALTVKMGTAWKA